jgi:hypothetical protein
MRRPCEQRRCDLLHVDTVAAFECRFPDLMLGGMASRT